MKRIIKILLVKNGKYWKDIGAWGRATFQRIAMVTLKWQHRDLDLPSRWPQRQGGTGGSLDYWRDPRIRHCDILQWHLRARFPIEHQVDRPLPLVPVFWGVHPLPSHLDHNPYSSILRYPSSVELYDNIKPAINIDPDSLLLALIRQQ